MRNLAGIKPILLAVTGIFLVATPGVAQTPAALASLQSGIWELRDLRRSSTPQYICIRNPADLFQIRHAGVACSRNILNQDSRSATARYECSGAEWGQTEISVETPRLVRVDTQGIEGGSPFHQFFEARRTGDCS